MLRDSSGEISNHAPPSITVFDHSAISQNYSASLKCRDLVDLDRVSPVDCACFVDVNQTSVILLNALLSDPVIISYSCYIISS